MMRDEAMRRIREAFPALQAAYGLGSIDIFGSVARDEAQPESDIDLLVTFLPGRATGYFGFFRLQKDLERILGIRVDLVTPDALKPQLRAAILAGVVHAA